MKTVQIINCMKHRADLISPSGEIITLMPSGHVATVTESQTPGEPFAGFPTIKTVMGEIVGLPDPQPGVVYYVNMLVFKAAVAAGRTDVVMGDSGTTAIRWKETDPEVVASGGKLVGLVRYITHLILP